ncbi:MAG: ATP-binding protein [Candidatus Magnetoovum sp. WYHC-5]|nr:ATP-binding protein [Candidatus Magnetoovum sp. WYHC-5]
MRCFYSYGPVNPERHFCVERQLLIEKCLNYLVDNIDEGGHYFSVWAPRQSGKTWLIQQVKKKIEANYGERFIVGTLSMQGVIFEEGDLPKTFLDNVPQLIKEGFYLDIPPLREWRDLKSIFYRNGGLFSRPVILLIDEFDSLPPKVIDRLITLFRDMYLKRDAYLLHGLALIGIRAVLGVESERDSPFNIQRSIHIPNFTKYEVFELFQQYIDESGQNIEPAVIERVYESTRGQPGLVCWFGELITEKYNTGINTTIDGTLFKMVYHKALRVEWNNTILNLVKKAKAHYKEYVVKLFAKTDIPFNMEEDWCNYLYTHGIISDEISTDNYGEKVAVCRFSCTFVQEKLYGALTDAITGDSLPIPALEILDTLEDVFTPEWLNLTALLKRYKDYLLRLRAKGLNPWKKQPRRANLTYTEAVGHFHLYAWLQAAIGHKCVISPEFPTGNGKVDLHINCGNQEGIIEVKSFTNVSKIKDNVAQAAQYAKQLNKDSVTIALFIPSNDAKIQEQLFGKYLLNNTTVTVVPIGWAV